MEDAPALFFPGTALDADKDDSILSYDEIDPDVDKPPGVLKYIMQEAEGAGGNQMGEPADDDPTISHLLVEQTEIADVVLLNKIDILQEDERTADKDCRGHRRQAQHAGGSVQDQVWLRGAVGGCLGRGEGEGGGGCRSGGRS